MKSTQPVGKRHTIFEKATVQKLGPGIYVFNPWSWNLYIRPTVSVLAGILVTFFIWLTITLITWKIGIDTAIPASTWPMIAIGLTTYFAFAEAQELEKVPDTKYYARVTWLGMPLDWYRETGDYEWQGTSLGFGRTRRIRPEFTDKDGFIIGGKTPFRIWNKSTSKSEDGGESQTKPIIIKAPAKNQASISATITLILRLLDPSKMLDHNDPELDLGERTRQEFRELTGWFTDTDLPLLQDAVSEALIGKEIITCFLREPCDVHKSGAMVRDYGGIAMYKLVDYNALREEYPEHKDKTDKELRYICIELFKSELNENMHSSLKEAITNENGEAKLSYVRVKQPITQVIKKLGFELIRTTVADIIFSDKVQEAADEAASEPYQLAAQEASAKAIAAARQLMLPTEDELKNPAWKLAMAISAAQDDKRGNIKVLLSETGNNPFAEAAAVGATQLGGNA